MDQPQITHSATRLSLLYRLVQAFNSSLSMEQMLDQVMDEVIQNLHAERGFLMLYDSKGELNFQTARGMDRSTIQDPEFQISQSIVQRVASEGEPILTSNAQTDGDLADQRSILRLGLRSVLCVPLKLKERIIGLIYVDNRLKTGIFNVNDREMLTALASNAAVAIENARLYIELSKAYDTTLEGWALALELRDKETQGHSKRVVELTLQVGQTMGLSAAELLQMKRGALLHDIGKMGIPDSILLKAGPLTDEEWVVMKKHPEYAYRLLCGIEYLLPTLDIPYCHHEKWDGSGYPRGLKGEEIPLAARIFSVVDVWDALTSENRPYRKAWSRMKTIKHLQEKAGRDFDPEVVKVFLTVMENDNGKPG